ncbi:MEKHLA domain-containing protein [Cyanobium sp. LEGE 06113]|uniref:MEKHLA domain-containing protein n=1 Tax=Cyanobium sp. LEGE 06113 TaxID=1297573 RepID=UPI0018801353|nr:MEKHLA domain-containing protein [Cyanobium sp. LEGE 06113]MBE9154345.1 MEKHLA domain-containing protein [Cyanobium sp. LEGE 06113]
MISSQAKQNVLAGWLQPDALQTVCSILQSHQQAFGRPLLAGLAADASDLQRAQALFASPAAVLAHDGADPDTDPGPRLIYANRSALVLWRRRWGEMVGLPSKFTAAAQERSGRQQALRQARAAEALSGYGGVRIDSRGRRFRIEGARLWTLRDANGCPRGQAARFSAWYWL